MSTPLRIATVILLVCLSLTTAAEQPSYQQQSQATKLLADVYFKAYIDLDWDTIEPILGEDAYFLDPTATAAFGNVQYNGKPAMMKNFRENYAGITKMTFHPSRVIYSGNIAVFEGTLDWGFTLRSGAIADTKDMPFITILTFENGKVISHRDYGDYQPFFDAYNAAMANN